MVEPILKISVGSKVLNSARLECGILYLRMHQIDTCCRFRKRKVIVIWIEDAIVRNKSSAEAGGVAGFTFLRATEACGSR
jgi:hypothetical protein